MASHDTALAGHRSANETAPARGDIARALALSLAMLVFLLALAPATMFWDRDEAYYARTAVEMLQSGDWLVPRLNNEVFVEKPPLDYWLMAGSFAAFGETEFAARLPSAVAMAASTFMMFLIGARMFGRRTGFLAAAMLPSSLMAVYLGSTVMLDALLLFSVLLSSWAYVELVYRARNTAAMVAVFGVGVLLSLLAKGPVGPAVLAGLVALSWLLGPSGHRLGFGTLAALFVSALAALGLFLLWAIPANDASGGVLFADGFGKHVIGRSLRPLDNHGSADLAGYLASLPVYIPVILIGFVPWTTFLPAGFALFGGGKLRTRRERVLLAAMFLPTFVLFSAVVTKLPHYVLPAFPALAFLSAATVMAFERKETDPGALFWLRAGALLGALLSFGGAAALIVGYWLPLPGATASVFTLVVALVIAASAVWVAREQWRGRTFRATAIALVSMLAILLALFWLVAPPLEPAIKISRPMADAVIADTPPDAEIYVIDYREPSLLFYLRRPYDRPVHVFRDADEATAAVLAETHDAVLIAPVDEFAKIEALSGDRGFAEIGHFAALNTNRSLRRDDMVVALRKAAPNTD